jgi:hypothetical protein
MLLRIPFFALALAASATTLPGIAQSTDLPSAAATAATSIPNLIRYTGTAPRSDDKAGPVEVSITFLIFKDQQGGDPLWTETQTAAVNAAGHYAVDLGATSANGLPADLFASGEARWLEVQVAGGVPERRTLLASVPYAMKAADAATLGGLPASAFLLAATKSPETQSAASPETSANVVTTPGGTAGYLPAFSGGTTVDDSILFESGTKLGIGTNIPAATLDVNGSLAARGALTLESNGTATAAGGRNSQPLDFMANAYNAATKTAAAPLFALQAEALGNNTTSPAGTLNLLYGNGTTPVETGLSISSKGVVKFASGQTFPGSGTITGVTTTSPLAGSGTTGSVALSLNLPALEASLNAKYPQLAVASKFTAPVTFGVPVTFASTQTFPGIPGGGTITGVTTTSPLSGSGTKGSVALSLNLPALETTLNTKYAQLGAANIFTQPITFATGQTFPGAGTITAVTAGAGLTGGGTTGAIKLALDPKVVPTLTGSPVFNGSSGDGMVGDTAGNTVGTAGVLGVAGSGNSSGFGGIAGVWGNASAHVGALGTSDQYAGVQGISSKGPGVQGSSTSNIGVEGSSNEYIGVQGTSNQYVGVYGQSGAFSGVEGISTSGSGISGISASGPGASGSSTASAGMIGYTAGSTLNTGGVIGIAGPRTNFSGISGIWGDAANHVGVQGTSNIYTGVQGSSVSGPGVQGNSTSGNGIHGLSANTSGIFAETTSTSGGDAALYAYSHNNALGVFGFSPKFGIEGESGGNSGVGAQSSVFVNGPAAVWGDTNGAGYAVVGTTDSGVAGEFINNSSSQEAMYVGNFYNGNSTVATLTGEKGGCTFFGNGDVLCEGTISSAVISAGGGRALKTYSVQAAENWYEDAGSAQLVNGVAHVQLEPAFGQTVNTGIEYHVFLTPGGDSEGLYVSNKTEQGFEVHEQHGGHSNIAFDYRIMAKRAGHENERLEDVTERMKKQAEMRARMLRADKAPPATPQAPR